MLKVSKTIGRYLIYAFFAFIPFQIGGLFWTDSIYSSGFFSPYLSFQFYITDLFLLLGVFLLSFSFILEPKGSFKFGDRRILISLILFLLAVLLSVLFSTNYINSLFYLFRICEFVLLYFLFLNRVVILEKVLKLIVFVLALVSVLGIFQYILQHSLGLSFIGEPVISSETLGVAKVALFDLEVLRSYGTFPHPNIFGAYLVLGILICIFLLRKSNKNARFYLFPALAVFCLTLILTFSRSAFLALFVSLIFYYVVSRIKVSLKYILSAAVLVVLFVYFLDLSSVLSTRIFLGDSAGSIERWQYLDISKNMFMDKPFGVGIGNFTALMQDYSSSKILPWNFQPVHNLYLLVLNEIGVQGFLLFLCFLSSLFLFIWKKLRNRELAHFLLASFLALFVLSLFDHYLFSIYQGQALFLTFVAMIGALDYH